MNSRLFSSRVGAILCAAIASCFALPAMAADWSDTEVQYVTGGSYREPFNPGPANDTDVKRNIITFQHASGTSSDATFSFSISSPRPAASLQTVSMARYTVSGIRR